jgi:Domain of unknown function (DUF4169)
MGDVVNLRRARKTLERLAKEQSATENRFAFGRTKAEKQAAARQAERESKRLDGAQIEAKADPDRSAT